MSGLRCWPGALAYTAHPRGFGHLVECIHIAPRDAFPLPDGFVQAANPDRAPAWVVRLIGAPVECWVVRGDGNHWKRLAQFGVLADHYLRPILPPPGTDTTDTDDSAPRELEHPAFG